VAAEPSLRRRKEDDMSNPSHLIQAAFQRAEFTGQVHRAARVLCGCSAAHSGPCTLQIIQLERQIQHAGSSLESGPTAQLGRVAAIMCGSGAERSCLVKDFSDGGVRLQTNGLEIPDEFVLLFAPNDFAQSGRYKVVWRLGNDVGAKFHESCR
jgi:hypothetical protein